MRKGFRPGAQCPLIKPFDQKRFRYEVATYI